VRVKSQQLVEENSRLRVLSANGLSKDIDICHQEDCRCTLSPVSSTLQPTVSAFLVLTSCCRSLVSLLSGFFVISLQLFKSFLSIVIVVSQVFLLSLFLWPPYGIGQAIIFSSCGLYLLSIYLFFLA